ncbi:collagen triple helix repeat-containing protein 1-like isoform X2 [Corticium candelabrum]|uniref:collagen triple helix repeat-containing protein 1-like isoform X2 n=1 Tax=Corticium candelabrum TaxID=121492 RepID=UPI002E263AC8|nr:collagen triple helix repeat-containing protein 1-like isoform X2 [Corticium candelabrum]
MFSFFVTVLVLIQVIATSGGQSVSDERNQQTCVSAGVPGVPGLPGRDGMKGGKGMKGEKGLVGDVGSSKGNAGKIGPQGMRGEQGRKGETGSKGEKGLVGDAGTQGINGDEGRKGIKGERGLVGDVGSKGNAGERGPQGPQGPEGLRGIKGETGRKGEKGEAMTLNWKQCVWYRNDWQNIGLIQNCNFRKHDSNSALHVAYAGTLRVRCRSGACCSRCRIDDDPHRHRQIEGYCENIPAGQVTIGFNIGICNKWTSTTYDGATGWRSVSRIMIAEVPPSQK